MWGLKWCFRVESFEVSRGPLSIDSNIKKKVSNLSSPIVVTIEL